MSDCVATFAGTDGLASTLQRCYTEAWSIRARPAPVHIPSIDFCAGEEQSAERARPAAPCTAPAAAAAARRLAKLRPVYSTLSHCNRWPANPVKGAIENIRYPFPNFWGPVWGLELTTLDMTNSVCRLALMSSSQHMHQKGPQ